jgi:hypothetical protein
MHAIVRSYEGLDLNRSEELSKKVNETLLPSISKLPGFKGYFMIDAGNSVMTSIGLFENATQADESTRIAANWVRDEQLESLLPNAPKVTGGNVLAHVNGITV